MKDALATVGKTLSRGLLEVQAAQNYQLETAINTRIVVDPATLLPYTHEERVHWYVSLGTGAADKILQSEHLVLTTRYQDPSLHAAAQAHQQP